MALEEKTRRKLVSRIMGGWPIGPPPRQAFLVSPASAPSSLSELQLAFREDLEQASDPGDIRLLSCERLRNVVALVFANRLLGLCTWVRAKLKILVANAFEKAQSISGISGFHFYAIADGSRNCSSGRSGGLGTAGNARCFHSRPAT